MFSEEWKVTQDASQLNWVSCTCEQKLATTPFSRALLQFLNYSLLLLQPPLSLPIHFGNLSCPLFLLPSACSWVSVSSWFPLPFLCVCVGCHCCLPLVPGSCDGSCRIEHGNLCIERATARTYGHTAQPVQSSLTPHACNAWCGWGSWYWGCSGEEKQISP